MNYEGLAPEDLAALYLDKPEERKLIEEHVSSLSEYLQGYFKHLLQEPEPLPFQNFAAHNISSPKRDGHILWSDLHNYDSLVWHYQQQKADLINNNPAPNIPLFIEREIIRAKEMRSKLLQSFNSSDNVSDDDKYSLYISVQDRFISFLESEKAAKDTNTLNTLNGAKQLIDVADPPQHAAAITHSKKQLNITTDHLSELIEEAKKYFDIADHDKLEALLKGGDIQGKILFCAKSNQWAEVFGRLKYNGLIPDTKQNIKVWLCTYFRFEKGKTREATDFNESTVHSLLTKGQGEPKRQNRICIFEWLPYITIERRRME